MNPIQTTLKNRLALLGAIQNSDWFKDLERSKLLIDTEGTIDGQDPNKAPEPGTPLNLMKKEVGIWSIPKLLNLIIEMY